MPRKWTGDDDYEERLRELREKTPPVRTPDESLDALAREDAPVPTRTPIPTPEPSEDWFGGAPPVVETPTPRQTAVPPRQREMTAEERFALSADPLEMMQKVARDQGWEDHAVPYLAATKDIAEKEDYAGMSALAAEANAHNNAPLQRAVGKKLMFSVPFDALDNESKQFVNFVITRGAFGYQREDMTVDKSETAIAEALGLTVDELGTFREKYLASDFADADALDKFDRDWRLAAMPQMSMVDIVSLATLPFGGGPALMAAATLGFSAFGAELEEAVPGPKWVGKAAGLGAFIVATRGVALTGPAAEKWLMSWFAVVEPELIATALDPNVPIDDRVLSGAFAATPALGFFGPILRGIRLGKADVAAMEGALKAEVQILGMTSTKDISTWRYSGHSAENAASIRANGFIPERGGWMALTENRASGFGDTVLQVRPTRQLKLVEADSRVGRDVGLEVERRYDAQAEAAKRAGRDPGEIIIDDILRDVLKESGFDGWVKGGEGDIFVVDGRLIEVNGSPMPGTIGQAEWMAAGGVDVRTTALEGPSGLSDPPQFGLELKPGETPKGRLAAAKAASDWLDTLNTWAQRKLGRERLAGKAYAGLANWLASGASKFLSEAHMAIQLYKEGLQTGLVWSATQAAHVRNNVKTAFADIRVSGTKEAGQFLEAKLRDGNWHRLDEIMEGRKTKLLTELQEGVVQDWAGRTEGIHGWALENGYEAGTWKGSPSYWPRRRIMEVMEAAGLRPAGGRRPGAKTAGAKHREFELQRTGEEKAGAKYWVDLDTLLTDHFNGKVQGVLDAYLKRWTDTFSETLKTRLLRQAADVYNAPREAGARYKRAKRDVETDLQDARDAISGRIRRIQRDLTKAENKLSRIRGRIQGRAGKRATPKDTRDLSAVKTDVAKYKADLTKYRAYLKEVPKGKRYVENHPDVVTARNEIYTAVNARELAMEHLVNSGAEHLVTDIPIMSDRVFTWENYMTVKKGLERPDIGQLGRSAVEMSALQRSMKAAFDDSSALLTQWGVAMAHPLAWTNIMAEAARTMMKGGRYEQIMLDARAVKSAKYGLVQGANEMGRPGGTRSGVIGVVERTPVVGHGLRASNFAFGATGDIARQMLWRLWHESWYKRWGEKGLYDLADHINRMTGVVRAGAPIEAALFFAPKFARAIMSMPATMVRGGPKGRAARIYFLRLWTSATVLTVLLNQMRGTPFNLDARDYGLSERERDGRPEPYSVPVPGGGSVQLAGPFAPYLRTIFHAAKGDFMYAGERGVRGKFAPMPGVFADIGFREQYMGEKMPNPFEGEWADTIRYMAEQFTPFSVSQGAENIEMQAALSDDPWEVIRNSAPGLILEFFGARFTPDFISSLVNERARELVADVQGGRLELSKEATGIINEFGDEYKTWGEIPVDIRRELELVDDDLAKILEIRKEKGMERDNAYSKMLELSSEQADNIQQYGKWLADEETAEGEPYTEGQYIKDVHATVANVRTRMDALKKALGVEDELPDDAPAEARLLEEYITTVLEPSLDYKDDLDGEEYEKLYDQMAARHVDETIPLADGTEMTMMERLDRMLAYKEDAKYREYRADMLKLRPYWDFMDTAWTAEFVTAAELEYIQPSAPLSYETPAAFEKFLVADLKREFMTNGLGDWGSIPTSQEKNAPTYEEEFGAALMGGDQEVAEALAIKMADRVMKDFYVQRAVARDSWLLTHPDVLDLLMKWDVGSLGKSPPIGTLRIRTGAATADDEKPRKTITPSNVPRR